MFKTTSSLFLICALLCASGNNVFAEDNDDLIIEKNLFDADRKKWIMEEPKEKKSEPGKEIKKEIAEISLFGTIVAGNTRYAVLRTKKGDKKDGNEPYMVGDYIGGFLVKEIDARRVTLRDESDSKEYVIFINDEKKDRTAEKTEIKAEEPEKARKAEGAKEGEKKKPVKQGESGDMMKKRVQKNLDVLKSNKSDLVIKQAEKDFQKYEKVAPMMNEDERQELIRMKQEFEKLKGG